MSRPNFLLLAVAVLGLVLFVFFLEWLLMLRYERGDVYPAYSTLRADPMGARAYFEALKGVPGVTTVRGFDHLREELGQKPRTLFLLGYDRDELSSFSEDELAQLDDYVKNGGRVVLTFSPERANEESSENTSGKKETKVDGSHSTGTTTVPDEKKPDSDQSKADKDDAPAGPMTQQEKYERDDLKARKALDDKAGQPNPDPSAYHYVRTVTALWGFDTDDTEEKAKPGDRTEVKANDDDTGDGDEKPKADVLAFRSAPLTLERVVPWKSALYFVRLEPEWQELYAAKSKPVLLRRSWGKGEIILASDSYFVSDEALRNNRSPELLSLLAGSGGLLLFDETHLGTQQQEGVVYLMNKYHLAGGLYALLVVLLLCLWRNSIPLVPPSRGAVRTTLGGTVSGKDSRSGLVNLLRRNLVPAQVLPAALTEWQRTVATTQPHLKEKTAAMNAALAAQEMKRPEQIVQLYHQLREINTPRNPSTYATKS